MPRKSKRTPKVVAEILKRLELGHPLAVICRSEERFPHPSIWGDWCAADESLAIAYARARAVGHDTIAAETIAIVDDVTEDPASRKVRAETRLKLLAKWDPKRYGDAILHKHADADGEKLNADPTGIATRAAALIAAALARTPNGTD